MPNSVPLRLIAVTTVEFGISLVGSIVALPNAIARFRKKLVVVGQEFEDVTDVVTD
jgi:hypothetical protein